MVLPQGLCTCSSLNLNALPKGICMACALIHSVLLAQCHLFTEVSADHSLLAILLILLNCFPGTQHTLIHSVYIDLPFSSL